MASPFTLENPVFSKFAVYSTVVLSKTVVMSELTGFTRLFRKVFANEEDAKSFGKPGTTVNLSDPLIERMRRCHLNDLENVLPFVLVGLLYVSTKPEITEATRVFQIFTASRILHTVVYLTSMRQPSRTLAFFTGYGVTSFMIYKIYKAVF